MDMWTVVSPFYDAAAHGRYVLARVDYVHTADPQTGSGGELIRSHLEQFAAMGTLEAFVDVEFEDDGWVNQAHLAYGLRGSLDKPDGLSSGAFQVMELEIRREPSGQVKTSVRGAAPQRLLGSDLTFEDAFQITPPLFSTHSISGSYTAGWVKPWANLGVTLEAY